jgi:hypothetical protein
MSTNSSFRRRCAYTGSWSYSPTSVSSGSADSSLIMRKPAWNTCSAPCSIRKSSAASSPSSSRCSRPSDTPPTVRKQRALDAFGGAVVGELLGHHGGDAGQFVGQDHRFVFVIARGQQRIARTRRGRRSTTIAGSMLARSPHHEKMSVPMLLRAPRFGVLRADGTCLRRRYSSSLVERCRNSGSSSGSSGIRRRPGRRCGGTREQFEQRTVPAIFAGLGQFDRQRHDVAVGRGLAGDVAGPWR